MRSTTSPLRISFLVAVGLALIAPGARADSSEGGGAQPAPDSCVEAGKGEVGESGASSLAIHQVTGTTAKLAVLRTAGTSLCPDTGAVAMLVVNGKPTVHGDLTADRSSIQTEVQPGDRVVAVVHTVPLFNETVCIRLGELRYRLEQCEAEG